MKKHPVSLKNERVLAYIQIVLGSTICALAYPMFLVPNAIAPGGVTGIATILNYIFHWPVGITSLCLNVPLFILGYRSMGRVFVFRSLVTTVLFSLLIDLLPASAVTADPLLGSVFGGVLLGGGLGLILRGGATSGGSDMIARMVHKHFQHISMGAFLMSIDFTVVLAAGFFIQVEHALYAFISIYVATRVIDVVLEGFTKQKACYIISPSYEDVKRQLLATIDRGVTLLHGQGGFSGEDKPILLCIVTDQELSQVKAVVRQVDENAFVFITDAFEVLGEGFSKLGD